MDLKTSKSTHTAATVSASISNAPAVRAMMGDTGRRKVKPETRPQTLRLVSRLVSRLIEVLSSPLSVNLANRQVQIQPRLPTHPTVDN